MKIYVCLLAVVCTCNATFLNLLSGKGGGDSHVTYNVIATPTHFNGGGGQGHSHGGSYARSHGYSHGHSHGHGHGQGSSAQVIKLVVDQSSVNPAQSYGNGYASGHSYEAYGHGHEQAQIFKVITESAAAPAPGHIEHGYSTPSYASAYSHGGSHSVNSQLTAILPQILQVILQDDARHSGGFSSGGGSDLSSQLIANFGHKGRTVITRLDGKNSNSFYSGGHVIQKGVLKLMRVQNKPAAAQHAPGHISHGSPVHAPPASHGHGW